MVPLAELTASRTECRALADRAVRLEDDLRRAEERLQSARAECTAAKLAADRARSQTAVEEAKTTSAAARGLELELTVRKMQVRDTAER